MFLMAMMSFMSSGFCSYVVPTASMDPTIKVQDRFFANKLAYRLKIPFTKTSIIAWSTPQRGDIIVFKYPKNENTAYNKRVIGLPGERIMLKDKQVFINDEALPLTFKEETEEYYIYEENLNGLSHLVKFSKQMSDADNMKEIAIPPGNYFVMGDNRNNGSDSRFWGFVPMENIDGKLIFRWFASKEESYTPDLERFGKLQ